jgi:hypothetical protein
MFSRAAKRNSKGFGKLAEEFMARSAARKRRVIMMVDGARFHRPEKSRLARQCDPQP